MDGQDTSGPGDSLIGFKEAMMMMGELENANAAYVRVLKKNESDENDAKQVRYLKAYRAVVDQLALSTKVDHED